MEHREILGMRIPVNYSLVGAPYNQPFEEKSITRVKPNFFYVSSDDVDYFINVMRKEYVNFISENAFNIPDGAVCKPSDGTRWYLIYRASVNNWVCAEGYDICPVSV